MVTSSSVTQKSLLSLATRWPIIAPCLSPEADEIDTSQSKVVGRPRHPPINFWVSFSISHRTEEIWSAVFQQQLLRSTEVDGIDHNQSTFMQAPAIHYHSSRLTQKNRIRPTPNHNPRLADGAAEVADTDTAVAQEPPIHFHSSHNSTCTSCMEVKSSTLIDTLVNPCCMCTSMRYACACTVRMSTCIGVWLQAHACVQAQSANTEITRVCKNMRPGFQAVLPLS